MDNTSQYKQERINALICVIWFIMEKQHKVKKILLITIGIIALAIVMTSGIGYYLMCKAAISRIESLNMPDGITVYGQTKAEASDIYWVHMSAEKVIICDGGPEYVQKYLEENNSDLALMNIDVEYFTGMTDMCMYDFDRLSDEERGRILADDSDRYVRIVYEHKYFWLPVSWYYMNPIS